MRPSTVYRHGSVVQDSAGRLVLEHPTRLALTGINKITCLVDTGLPGNTPSSHRVRLKTQLGYLAFPLVLSIWAAGFLD